MSASKHYVNPKEPGQLCFVTTTCLDFAHLFKREEMRSRMCLSLLQSCKKMEASLRGYVVMTHHVHLLVRPAETDTISTLMQEIKEKSAKDLSLYMLSSERDQLKMQEGLGRRTFWKRSFRANPIYTAKVYDQKLHYLHANPIRSGMVESIDDYPWSSAPILMAGHYDEAGTIDIAAAIPYYEQRLASL